MQEEMSKMAKGRGGPSVASLNNVLMQVCLHVCCGRGEESVL